MIRFLDLAAQYASIQSEVDAAIAEVLRSASFVGGKHVQDFEREFAAFHAAEHCVGVGNGTDAIEIAIEALGLPSGSEIVVPANSFIASSEAVTRAGHRVVFADVDPDTYLIDLKDVERRLTHDTSAIIAVHLYGRPVDMDALNLLAARSGIRVIEDCAQAHGAESRGRRVGALGDVGTFSFYPGKNLGAFGDGGAIVTNDQAVAQHCRMIANHGRTDKYIHEFEGRNSRLDALQAAVLTVKLHHLDTWLVRRNEVAERYYSGLEGTPGLAFPRPAEGDRHAYHLFVVEVDDPVGLRSHLQSQGIECGHHYPVALPKQPAYAYLGDPDLTMFANQVDERLISLPMGEHLSDDDVDSVVAEIRTFQGKR